jgi:hypothetical protein
LSFLLFATGGKDMASIPNKKKKTLRKFNEPSNSFRSAAAPPEMDGCVS